MFRPAAAPIPAPVPADEAHAPADGGPVALPPEAVGALDRLLGEGRVVAHHPCFARVFGGAACGLLLSQFWFWSGTPTVRGRDGGWFWKPQREITDETGLTRAETETARRRLCALGVLEEERRGLPATLHFRLDTAAVQRRLWAHVQSQFIPAQPVPAQTAPAPAPIPQTGSPIIRTLVRGNLADKIARSPQTTSERTSGRTQTKTQTGTRPALPAAFGKSDLGTGATISKSQCAVNRSGAARLKTALDTARKATARPGGDSAPPGERARAPPRRPCGFPAPHP